MDQDHGPIKGGTSFKYFDWLLSPFVAVTTHTSTPSLFEMVPPVLVQMTVVHEPSLQLLQFAAHLPPLLSKAPRFCALLFGELAMLDFSLCESRKAVLGPRAGGRPSMELTAAHRESGGALDMAYPCAFGPRTSDLASLGRRAMVWDWLSLCSTIIGLWGFIIPHLGWLC